MRFQWRIKKAKSHTPASLKKNFSLEKYKNISNEKEDNEEKSTKGDKNVKMADEYTKIENQINDCHNSIKKEFIKYKNLDEIPKKEENNNENITNYIKLTIAIHAIEFLKSLETNKTDIKLAEFLCSYKIFLILSRKVPKLEINKEINQSKNKN